MHSQLLRVLLKASKRASKNYFHASMCLISYDIIFSFVYIDCIYRESVGKTSIDQSNLLETLAQPCIRIKRRNVGNVVILRRTMWLMVIQAPPEITS